MAVGVPLWLTSTLAKQTLCCEGILGGTHDVRLRSLIKFFQRYYTSSGKYPVAFKDAALQPSLVIVYFGGNDSMGPHSSGLGPHVPLPEYIANMRKIATHLQSLSEKTRIIFLSCPPVNEAKVRGNTSKIFSELVRTNELCQNYSEACIKLCQEMGVKVVDLFTALQKRDDWMDACFTDGIHLSAEGSKIVAREILKVIKEADWEPSLHWKSMLTEFPEDSQYDLVAADGETTLNPSEWTYYWENQWD
ncbi:GDSL esterase/lipase CPRD49 isoform X2 [Corylus avellana]|uniref:GDSL esterase/lipase CPRD49 isoform X2 n=1 Tax=Corylus avellana TaxID=13451 RepID=UPI00286AAF0A|nr:GDSL esterase/lipase CPRD49 isoform X2 [Corylus avellana]